MGNYKDKKKTENLTCCGIFPTNPTAARYVSGKEIKNHNEKLPIIDINNLYGGIMKSINQFANDITKQRLQEKMQENG